MNKSQRSAVNEDLKTLIKAIYALLPSRNLISQLIMLLPLSEDAIQELFPEITEDVEYWETLGIALGLQKDYRGEITISYYYNTIAYALREFINRIFEILRDEKTRAAISALLGELVPNAEREWLEVRIKAALKEPSIGAAAKKILMLLTESPSISIKEIPNKLNISEQELKHCIYVLRNLKLIEVSGENVSLPYHVRERYISYIKKLLGGARNDGRELQG